MELGVELSTGGVEPRGDVARYESEIADQTRLALMRGLQKSYGAGAVTEFLQHEAGQASVLLVESKPKTDQKKEPRCKGVEPDLFFPDEGDPDAVARAKSIRALCPVRQWCLDQAIQGKENFGIWGGLTTSERRRLRRASSRAVKAIEGGV